MLFTKNKEDKGQEVKTHKRSVESKILLLIIILANCTWIVLFGLVFNKLNEMHTEKIQDNERIVDRIGQIEESIEIAKEVELQFFSEPSICTVDTETNTVKINAEKRFGPYAASVLECRPDERYQYTGAVYNYANQYSIIVTDETGNVLLKDLGGEADQTKLVEKVDYGFTIPAGGTKLYIQGHGGLVLKKFSCINVVSEIDELGLNQTPQYNNVIRNIQRIGDGLGYPSQSLDAFREAYRRGFRILLCDLNFTSDNVPVCVHDLYLNQHYKNVYDAKGERVSTENPIYISQNTYETLNQYSYGAQGYPLLKFTDMLELVKYLGVELYVEVKGMNEEQAKIACDLIREYGLTNKVSWSGDVTNMTWVVGNIETARVSTMPETITDDVIEELNSLKTGKNEVFVFGYDTTVLTEEIVDKLIENDIAFELGTPKTPEELIAYFKRGDAYFYCTGVETESFIAGEILIKEALKKE